MRSVSPDPAHLRRLALLLAFPETEAIAVLWELATQEPWLGEAIAELESLSLDHWQAEYTRLFLVGYPQTPCPPYESAYREGSMHGQAVHSLQDLYRRIGLEAQSMPADYLGTQLECAAYLADRGRAYSAGTEAPAGGKGLTTWPTSTADPLALATELWEEHLCRWLPRFAADLQVQTQLLLYRQLGAQLAQLCAGCSHAD
ncbi:molecular chaperone TorD family protein [Caldichromatium japonicum]|uniref:Molecular chaperone TorD family protein n=1 Tax=Caldichromatium japonicum TaxID=2699430 RepID=A0A6G7VE43_9GAMM|nr:molecular chaperone TorD family protein [Caldichromatium japonicum]QIK38222.1 molecular chaperone TorD family protein [Caldichromatium japonicum]